MTDFSYVDSALRHMEGGTPPTYWRHLHWGLFAPDADAGPEGFLAAAAHMTARVLRPGGTLALSDFVMAEGALARVAEVMGAAEVGEENWYGRLAKPLTSSGYARLAGRTGLALGEDLDVNQETLPTYDAVRAF